MWRAGGRRGTGGRRLKRRSPTVSLPLVARVAGVLLLLLLVAPLPARAGGRATAPEALVVGPAERLLVIAPHPDDETLGAGGLIQRVLERGGSVRVVLVTAGDGYIEAVKHETGELHPRPAEFIAYGEKRLREARAALRVLGDERGRLLLLGFPDGGLDDLLRAHWWRGSPERSRTTGATDPPYDEAIEPDLPYDGDDLRRELGNIVREMQPTMVALPDPFDRHPDHRATGFFALLAVADWVVSLPAEAPRPKLLAYLVHWPDWPRGWDAPTPLPPDTPLDLPPKFDRSACRRVLLTLDDVELAAKRAALTRYETQQRVMRGLLSAFERRNEPFCLLPDSELQRVEVLVEQGLTRTPRRQR